MEKNSRLRKREAAIFREEVNKFFAEKFIGETMNTILLILCNALSCFIISTILFQFMNGKYKKSSQSRYVYIVIETVTVIFTTCINMLIIPY